MFVWENRLLDAKNCFGNWIGIVKVDIWHQTVKFNLWKKIWYVDQVWMSFNVNAGGLILTWWLGLRGKWPLLILRRWWWWWRCDDDVWWQWWWLWSRKTWFLIRPFPYIWVCRSQSIKQGRLLLRGGLPLFRITPVEMMIVMRIIIFAHF